MTTLSTSDVLKSIMAEKFEVDPAKVVPEATMQDLGLDSLDLFDVLFDAEDKLHVKIPPDEVKVTTFADLVAFIDHLRTVQS